MSIASDTKSHIGMEGTREFDRDILVRCLTRYYDTLVRMGYMEESNIQHAPASGWNDSQVDAKSYRIMGRNETAIDLLRHLPYLKEGHDILPNTKPIEYLGKMWDDTVSEKMANSKSLLQFYPLSPFDAELEPGMICLTYGRNGTSWLIDTKEELIYPCGAQWDIERDQDDPPWLWHKPYAIQEYFDDLQRKLFALELIPLPYVIHKQRKGYPDELEHQVFREGEYEVRVSSFIVLLVVY